MSKRKAIPKKVRQTVYLMYNGHCAYCGTEIAYKDMQVDHATPLRIGGADDISNYMPACRSCNHYKAICLCMPYLWKCTFRKIHERTAEYSVLLGLRSKIRLER